jgi:N-glycosylase/DNA lyase
MVTPSNATNLKNMNISPILVPNFVETQFNNVTESKPTKATLLFTHTLMFSASAPIAARTRYSPMMMDIIAVDPGFKTITAHHVKRNPNSSPKILARYTCAPPLSGIAAPSSA